MNTHSTRKVIVTASAAAICTAGPWAATPAQAKTDTSVGGTSTSSIVEIDTVVALHKMLMASDYVTHAAVRAGDVHRAG
jgi:hypothetical protein